MKHPEHLLGQTDSDSDFTELIGYTTMIIDYTRTLVLLLKQGQS